MNVSQDYIRHIFNDESASSSITIRILIKKTPHNDFIANLKAVSFLLQVQHSFCSSLLQII